MLFLRSYNRPKILTPLHDVYCDAFADYDKAFQQNAQITIYTGAGLNVSSHQQLYCAINGDSHWNTVFLNITYDGQGEVLKAEAVFPFSLATRKAAIHFRQCAFNGCAVSDPNSDDHISRFRGQKCRILTQRHHASSCKLCFALH